MIFELGMIRLGRGGYSSSKQFMSESGLAEPVPYTCGRVWEFDCS